MLRFVDDNQDGVLSRNEVGKIIFEVMNRGDKGDKRCAAIGVGNNW